MTNKLERALEEQKDSTQQETLKLTGILGMPLGGQRVVEVPNRAAFVYVRLRNSINEVIQAYNNQVAPSYNLPVIVERQGNKYVVLGVDTARYENNWASHSPYLPRHGNTHSFDIESGGGGDIVWVYPRQFMPLLVFPSGSVGAPNVFVAPYTLKHDNGWKYVGNTGSPSLAPYRPTSPTGAVMGLVYLNTDDGNPYLLVNSGTVFSNSITGSSQIVPYIPHVTNPSNQIPLAAVRLITGTSQVSWDNIYDVRQFLHNTPTGTGGGGAINTGTLDARYLKLDASNDPVTGNLDIHARLGVYQDFAAGDAVVVEHDINTDSDRDVLQVLRTANNSSHLGNAIVVYDAGNAGGKVLGTVFSAWYGPSERLRLHPNATGSVVPYFFDTQHRLNTGTIHTSWRMTGTQVAYLDVSGTFHSNGTPLVKEAPANNAYVRKNAGWEKEQPTYLPFGVYSTINPITVSPGVPYAASLDNSTPLTLIRWSQAWYVETTNNGSHYWTIELKDIAGNTIASFNTSAGAASTWTLAEVTSFSPTTVSSSDKAITVWATKTGSPGNPYLAGPNLEVRR